LIVTGNRGCRRYLGTLGVHKLGALVVNFIGKEVERRAQEGEDISVIENTGPIKYREGQRTKTRAADAGLIVRAKRISLRRLMRESGVSQHAVERFLSGARLHTRTRARLAQAVEKAEREAAKPVKPGHVHGN
jgi:transposase